MSVANEDVLVLNRAWQPINFIPLPQAINKILNEKARIIDAREGYVPKTWEEWKLCRPTEGDETITTVSYVVRLPRVIVVNEYNKVPNHKTAFSRKQIYKRDDCTCQYCGCRPGTSELSIDHVTPKCQGGTTTWENCVLACVKCNARKAGRTPQQANMKLLKKPIKPTLSNLRRAGIMRCKTWADFLSVAYWNVELEQ